MTTEVELTCEEKLEAAEVRIKELEAVARKHIKDLDFQKASQLEQSVNPPLLWVTCDNMKDLWHAQRICISNERDEPKWNPTGWHNRKIIFDFNAESGEVHGCHLEP